MVQRMQKVSWRFGYLLIVIYASMLGMTVASVMYANYVSRKNTRQFCSVITIQDDFFRRQPPATDEGKRFASEFARLRRELDC